MENLSINLQPSLALPQAPTGGSRRVTYIRMAAGSPLVGRRWPLLVRWCCVLVPDPDGNIAEVFAVHAHTQPPSQVHASNYALLSCSL